METKDYKSIYIHNGCRNPKMTVVHEVPKRKSIFQLRMENVILKIRLIFQKRKINYYDNVLRLINLNMSLKDAELQKLSLFGQEYLNTTEYAWNNLKIAINDMNISFHQQIIKKLIREKTNTKNIKAKPE